MATSPDALISDARNYAVSVSAAATQALGNAIATVEQIGGGTVPAGQGDEPQVTITPPVILDPGAPPVYTGTRYTAEPYSGSKAPTLDSTGSLNLPPDPGSIPAVPAFIDPVGVRPSGGPDTSLIFGPPVLNTSITAPPAPDLDVNGIPKPVLVDITIPPAPTYVQPDFGGVRPSQPAAPPTDLDVQMRNNYSTIMPVMRDNTAAQLDAYIDHEFPQFRTALATLEAKLATYMEGGTALTPDIENAIYIRTLDRTDRDALRAKDEAWGKAARGGWTMPTPMLLMQMDNIDQERRNNNARAANEIAIKQAELEQNNLQFAVTQSANLRQIMLSTSITYFNGLIQINGQALEYARSVVDAVVKTYDLAARYAEIQTRIYESEAHIFSTKVQAALALIQAYESTIRGLLAQSEVNMAKVNTYRAQLEAVQVEANVYKTQVEAVEAQISIEQMKVALYNARVQAYVAQVNGFTAQWQGYAAAVQGEATKVSAAAEQVRAYQAKVQSYQALVQAKATEIEAKLKINQLKLENYRTDVMAYGELNKAKIDGVSAEIMSYDATLKAFVAKANAYSEESRANIAYYEVAQRGLIAAAQLQYQYLVERDQMQVARASGVARIAEAIGGIYAGIAQATLAGMNSLAASTETTTA